MNASTSIHLPQYYYQFGIIVRILNQISLPYIFLVGLVGLITNTSTVVLLSKNFITKNLKNKWTLIALALSDLLFNTALLVRGIHDISKQSSNRLCIIMSFLSHLAELLSACYTVLFTLQRYTAVRYPLKAAAGRHSSPIISLLIVLILSSIFCLILSSVNPYIDCHEELHLSWFIADALSSFVIPFFLILLFNILIVNFIRRHSRSPISVQSTLMRKKKRFKTNYKTYNHDETCITDNNTIINACNSIIQSDENENMELKTRKEDKLFQNDMEEKMIQTSTSFSFDQMNVETSSNFRPTQTVYRLSVLSRPSSQHVRLSSHDSLGYRFSGKSLTQSIDNDIIATMTTRTSQSIRVTRMLVLVSSCFLILNAPAHFCVIALKIYSSIDAPTSAEHIKSVHDHRIDHIIPLNNGTLAISSEHLSIVEDKLTPHLLYLAVYLTQWIAYASYSINFFLYSFSGIAFRTNLRQLINKCRKH